MVSSSAVLGAAAGTGLALLIAVTIVVYRYVLLDKFLYVQNSKKNFIRKKKSSH